MQHGTVFDIQRFSLHDGQGIRTIVFLKGCPLDCMWCSNPESKACHPQLFHWQNQCIGCQACVGKCPHGAIRWVEHHGIVCDRVLCTNCGVCCKTCYAQALVMRGQDMTADEILDEVMRDHIFYKISGGGVTLSGGEPLTQPDFACYLLERVKQEGLNTAIETAGYYPLDTLKKADPFVDTYLFDIKHTDPEKHKAFIGVDNTLILSNLEWLANKKRHIIFRTPVIPGFNDDSETLQSILDLANQWGVKQISLLPYHEYGRNKYTALGLEYPYRKVSDRISLDPELLVQIKNSLDPGRVYINIGG